jgi:hypothetical protein
MANNITTILVGGALMVIASSCEKGTHALIDVRSSSDVLFSIPEDETQYYCINSVEIRRYLGGSESTNYKVVWRIKLKPNQSGLCDLKISYPRIPPTFTAEITSERLPAGDYTVVIDGGIGTASGEFTIPQNWESKPANPQ